MRRSRLLILPLSLTAVLAGALALGLTSGEAGCPPGMRPLGAEREAGRGAEREAEARREARLSGCVSRKQPESFAELALANASQLGRSTLPAHSLRPGAYAAAVRERRAIARAGNTLPGTGGTWEPVGKGALIADGKDYDEVNGEGLADLAGRVNHIAYDAASDTVYAGFGQGGVWASGDGGTTWRSVGDGLPTQATGGVAVLPAKGGRPTTLVVLTGNDVYGGGATFSGLGAYRSTDGGRSWTHSDGIPSGALGFDLAVDPTDPDVVYAATGVGLYRSTDAGLTFTNVQLPTGRAGGKPDGAPLKPDCTGKGAVPGCYLANMVTDVVVQAPGGTTKAKGGTVVAAVGWRAGDKTSPGGYVESPNNGIYISPSGAPGSFAKIDTDSSGFSSGSPSSESFQGTIGRVELGAATGPKQDHNYLYAIVQDATAFKSGQVSGIDVPEQGPATPSNTYLRGIYVSKDFGRTWTLMGNATSLQDPTTGSALTGTACAVLYCPGIQAWYNMWIKPDPTQQDSSGVPTRLTFGLEELWQNDEAGGARAPASGPTKFKVIGRYFAGDTCMFLNNPLPQCPTNRGDPNSTTTHPDQHDGLYVPRPGGGVTLFAGGDGGIYAQTLKAGEEFSNTRWGRGINQGLHTLLPYDAQVANDGTVWAGLQDNGQVKIGPDGSQFMTYGGDGFYTAVDPDNSQVAYEEYALASPLNVTVDGGKTWKDISPPSDSYQFSNPFVMDPGDANHLLTAGNNVYETTAGPNTTTPDPVAGPRDTDWQQVFTLGKSAAGVDLVNSAVDVRSIATGATQGLPTGPKTADAGGSAGDATVPGGGTGLPATYDEHPFTIGPNDGDASATISVKWASANDDWDLYVYRVDGDTQTEVGRSAQGNTTSEQVVLKDPKPGKYVIHVDNFAATGTYDWSVAFTQRSADPAAASGSAAYVAACGPCEVLTKRPFANALATNVVGGKGGKPGSKDGWHLAKAAGLPNRYITSVQVDPGDPATVYATVAGYSRRWLPVGVLGEDTSKAASGHVFKSTDAGETFKDVSGNLPDVPADFVIVRNGQLIVATDLGVFASSSTDGGTYELLGSGLPAVPVLSLELKPNDPNTLYVATQGRGVYRYVFRDPPPSRQVSPTSLAVATGGSSCAAGAARRAASARPARNRRGLRLTLPRLRGGATVEVFQVSHGRRIYTERLVARFAHRRRSFTWNGRANRRGRRVTDGYFFVRIRGAGGLRGRGLLARTVMRRSHGRWSLRPDHFLVGRCGLLTFYKLERPVFGGVARRPLRIAYRTAVPARVTVRVYRGKRLVRRFPARTTRARRVYRLQLPVARRPRGDYQVVLYGVRGRQRVLVRLVSRLL